MESVYLGENIHILKKFIQLYTAIQYIVARVILTESSSPLDGNAYYTRKCNNVATEKHPHTNSIQINKRNAVE